ncbi:MULTISPECIES: hypothetical protein [Actinokineospora]|uniref:Uncharacterized protein n=1 Tax=Actinokineospora fastidiosa TaxID=1816 RepID=A0A918L748_9PSEU|nr:MULTISPECIES: hypothetical protein [Actinokineospora]UVS76613.1 hypothetical protein Actkin_00306 [Actinokineospora sp. UTMC 2448]GGS17009.1 hypothetical protein GCM10010171_06600 [Actinokineospora fastidiosa]
MEQLSFYSAEASTPAMADLAGLLCGPGRIRLFARGTARLTVPVAGQARAKALVSALGLRGVAVSRHICEYTGELELRTAFRADLAPLALEWGQRKRVPDDFTPDGNTLRLWTLAAGRWTDGGYLLGTDGLAPHTRDALVAALGRCGLPASAYSGGLRIRGRRRLARLGELVGRSPGLGCDAQWPTGTEMRVVS